MKKIHSMLLTGIAGLAMLSEGCCYNRQAEPTALNPDVRSFYPQTLYGVRVSNPKILDIKQVEARRVEPSNKSKNPFYVSDVD